MKVYLMSLRSTCTRVSLLSTLLWIGGAGLLHAQSGTISGTILDQAGKAVPGAAVTVKSETATSGTGTSDSDGKFSVTGLGAGEYSVEASAPGFAARARLRQRAACRRFVA